MATVAYQTIRGRNPRRKPDVPSGKPPALMNSCRGWAQDAPMIRSDYPEFAAAPTAPPER